MKCGDCKHWNFKVDGGNGAFGQCLNPAMRANWWIDTKHCKFWNMKHPEGLAMNNDIYDNAAVQFEENFGCILFEAEEEL